MKRVFCLILICAVVCYTCVSYSVPVEASTATSSTSAVSGVAVVDDLVWLAFFLFGMASLGFTISFSDLSFNEIATKFKSYMTTEQYQELQTGYGSLFRYNGLGFPIVSKDMLVLIYTIVSSMVSDDVIDDTAGASSSLIVPVSGGVSLTCYFYNLSVNLDSITFPAYGLSDYSSYSTISTICMNYTPVASQSVTSNYFELSSSRYYQLRFGTYLADYAPTYPSYFYFRVNHSSSGTDFYYPGSSYLTVDVSSLSSSNIIFHIVDVNGNDVIPHDYSGNLLSLSTISFPIAQLFSAPFSQDAEGGSLSVETSDYVASLYEEDYGLADNPITDSAVAGDVEYWLDIFNQDENDQPLVILPTYGDDWVYSLSEEYLDIIENEYQTTADTKIVEDGSATDEDEQVGVIPRIYSDLETTISTSNIYKNYQDYISSFLWPTLSFDDIFDSTDTDEISYTTLLKSISASNNGLLVRDFLFVALSFAICGILFFGKKA